MRQKKARHVWDGPRQQVLKKAEAEIVIHATKKSQTSNRATARTSDGNKKKKCKVEERDEVLGHSVGSAR